MNFGKFIAMHLSNISLILFSPICTFIKYMNVSQMPWVITKQGTNF